MFKLMDKITNYHNYIYSESLLICTNGLFVVAHIHSAVPL